MPAEPASLIEVASSVADGVGDELNWPALEARAADVAERRALGHLRVVANVARLYRNNAADAQAHPHQPD